MTANDPAFPSGDFYGISHRDLLAMIAMPQFIAIARASSEMINEKLYEWIARSSYEVADAMLKFSESGEK